MQNFGLDNGDHYIKQVFISPITILGMVEEKILVITVIGVAVKDGRLLGTQ